MSRKKLSEKDMRKMEELFQQGKTPGDVSKYFDIAISSVHNYKRTMKDKGIPLPDIRGQRPKGITLPRKRKHDVVKDVNIIEKNPLINYLHLKINDVDFYIHPSSKNVRVEKNYILVEF